MLAYIVRRLLLIIPTLLGIMVINFVIINMAPGGPIEQLISNLRQGGDQVAERTGSSRGQEAGIGQQTQRGTQQGTQSRAGRGLDPELLEKLRKQLNFDKPIHERFRADDGELSSPSISATSYLPRTETVVNLVLEKMPVSISLGPLVDADPLCGLHSARHPQGGEATGPAFDLWTSDR